MTQLRVYLVRHGETDANRQGIVQGQLDTQLNELGQNQAELVAWRLRSVSFDIALASDLSRATKTAEAILAYHQGLTLVKHKELRERSMGGLQGKMFMPGINWPLAADDLQAETEREFVKRVKQWWDGFISEFAAQQPNADGKPREAIVVSHGGVIKTLLRHLIQKRRLSCANGVSLGKCGNTSVSIVEMGADGSGVLALYGDASHLAERGSDNPDEMV